MARKLRKDKCVWKGEWWWKETMLFDDLTRSESEFQRVGTATEKARDPVWVLTLRTDNKWKPDERSSLGLGDKESMENRYEDSPEERVCITIALY